MARDLTVPLAPGIWRVRLVRDFVNGFVLRDDDGQVTLVDMGIARSGPRMLRALEEIGSTPSDVTRLLLTHAHPDHAGGAAHVAEATGHGVEIHEADAGFARAGQGPPRDRTLRLGRLLDRLAPTGFPAVPVDRTLVDGERLPVGGGLRVIHTPGHSPGHTAFLHEGSGTLITGDAIFNVRRLRWPVAVFCSDFAMTKRTAHRLVEEDYELAAFTHGPELRERPRDAIREFLGREGHLG